MLHDKVLEWYTIMFPIEDPEKGGINIWFPNGKNSIRVRHLDGLEVVFTFNTTIDWSLMTLKQHLAVMKLESEFKQMNKLVTTLRRLEARKR